MIYLIIYSTWELDLTVNAYATKTSCQAALKRFEEQHAEDLAATGYAGRYEVVEIPYSRSKKQLCFAITDERGSFSEREIQIAKYLQNLKEKLA